MLIAAIDPGSERSALLCYEVDSQTVGKKLMAPNEDISAYLRSAWNCEHLVVEMVQHYGTGMAVGKSVFRTCVWIGRFEEAWGRPSFTELVRPQIKGVLCGSARARDANVRQALIDRFPGTGGGKIPQIGTKKQPGPLYGVKAHLWSALAVAVAWDSVRYMEEWKL